MTDRANKFIEKSNTPLWQFWDVSGRFIQDKDLADLLEQFLKESLPTDEEIEKRFPNATTHDLLTELIKRNLK
jgi:hypothetical protein